MFAKPFNLVLVYIVTVFNMAILSSPLIAFLIPFINYKSQTLEISDSILAKLKLAIFLILFFVSFFMLFYLFLDLLFGFAIKSSLKNCTPYNKIKDYDFLSKIFEEVKEKFAQNNVALYIKKSDEINAFAVASFGRKAIVLTSSLIDHYLEKSQNPKEFLYAIRSVISHEMSHLINKDFLPTYLIIANQKATNFVAYFLDIIFNFFTRFSYYTPYIGRFTSSLMNKTHFFLSVFFSFFNRFIVFNIYEFLRKFSSRAIEYRCDKQASQAFGGQNMAFALSFLGKSGYFTLFSTHPATQKRIEKVKNIDIENGVINPRFADVLSNYFSIMFLIIICLIFAKKAAIDLLVREYIRNHETIHNKLIFLINMIKANA